MPIALRLSLHCENVDHTSAVFVPGHRTTLSHSGFLVTDFITGSMKIAMAGRPVAFRTLASRENRAVSIEMDEPWSRPRHTHIWGWGAKTTPGWTMVYLADQLYEYHALGWVHLSSIVSSAIIHYPKGSSRNSLRSTRSPRGQRWWNGRLRTD